LILLDLAAISVYHSWHSEFPLFLLDDVDAELDRRRVSRLLEYLEGRTQTFVTTSKESLVEQYSSRAKVFEIRGGMAGEMSLERGATSTLSRGSLGI
jgi:DNA replication and repair protein RecF